MDSAKKCLSDSVSVTTHAHEVGVADLRKKKQRIRENTYNHARTLSDPAKML